jgi:Ca-activated chloride channel family protein
MTSRTFSRFFALNIFAVLIFAATAFGQTPTSTPPPDDGSDEVIRVDSRLVVIPVSVTTPSGDPILGLTTEDFKVAENGKPQVLETVGNAETVPLEFALLFDISATTSPMFRFQQETAAAFLMDVMKDADRATIYTIGASPILVKERATAAEAVAAVRSIEPTKELTAFYDTVSRAAENLIRNAPSGTRRVILVISDGEDTNSTQIAKAIQDGYAKMGEKINTLDNAELRQYTVTSRNTASARERVRVSKALQNADTVFYSINPAGSSYQLNKISVFGQENMQKFADETGGSAFLPKFVPIDTKDELQNSANMRKNKETLERIFNQLTNELRAQYLVQYYSEGDYPNGKYVRLDVGLRSPGTNRVRARDGYYVKN